MNGVHAGLGIAAMALTGGAMLIGAWCWWRVRSTPWFWRVLRAGQVAVIIEVLDGGLQTVLGHKPPGLHVLYGVLPILVAVIAEQLRIASAESVLDARGFASSADVGRLPTDEQQVIVLSIVQREIVVMTLASLVNVVLLARAAGTG